MIVVGNLTLKFFYFRLIFLFVFTFIFFLVASENSEEAKTADLISVGGLKDETVEIDEKNAENEEIEAGTIGGGSGCGQEDMIGILGSDGDTDEVKVDEDGYTIRPSPKAPLNRENSFDSSSDSDSGMNFIYIKHRSDFYPSISFFI